MLRIGNFTNKIKVLIDHAEIKYLEECIKSYPNNLEIRNKLETMKKDFLIRAENTDLID